MNVVSVNSIWRGEVEFSAGSHFNRDDSSALPVNLGHRNYRSVCREFQAFEVSRVPFAKIVDVRGNCRDPGRRDNWIEVDNWVGEGRIVADPCACWPAIVSAPYDDVDLIVGAGTSFGGDESPI